MVPASGAIIHAHYSNDLKKLGNSNGGRLCEGKLCVSTTNTPSSIFSLMHYATLFTPVIQKGSCQRGLLHIGSIKSWDEQ